MRRIGLLWAVISSCQLAAGNSTAQSDEAWINDYVDRRYPESRDADGNAVGAPIQIEVEQLGRHQGDRVQLHLVHGTQRRGVIVRVGNGEVTLSSQLHGGEAQLRVPLVSISRVELER